jgi:uncharacterized SAM-binding protein YcdF (DUF218 family)
VTELLAAAGALPAAWILAAVALDGYGRRRIPQGSWDAIVVPGCAVRPDGRPSQALSRRVHHAVAAWRAGRAPIIVFTGGVGRYPPAEAIVAAQLAAELGVPPSAVLTEERSTSTRENASMAAALIVDGAPAARWRVLVLSDAYHAWRCRRLFSRHFNQATARGSIPGRRLRIRGALREVGSIFKGLTRQ